MEQLASITGALQMMVVVRGVGSEAAQLSSACGRLGSAPTLIPVM